MSRIPRQPDAVPSITPPVPPPEPIPGTAPTGQFLLNPDGTLHIGANGRVQINDPAGELCCEEVVMAHLHMNAVCDGVGQAYLFESHTPLPTCYPIDGVVLQNQCETCLTGCDEAYCRPPWTMGDAVATLHGDGGPAEQPCFPCESSGTVTPRRYVVVLSGCGVCENLCCGDWLHSLHSYASPNGTYILNSTGGPYYCGWEGQSGVLSQYRGYLNSPCVQQVSQEFCRLYITLGIGVLPGRRNGVLR